MNEQDIAKARANAEQWLDARFDEQTRNEVEQILKQPEVLLGNFLRPMEFGTAGLRGVMAPGIFCMNSYTMAAAIMGIARFQKSGRIVIAFDARKNSREFAELAAAILTDRGFSVLLFSEVAPTPVVPFVLLQGGADLGLVVTASHNPPKYNGLKVYMANGAQIISPIDRQISDEISHISILEAAQEVKRQFPKKLSCQSADHFIDSYLNFLEKQVLLGNERDISIIYTPLHGAAGKIMMAAFDKAKFNQALAVESQLKPDGNFPTVKAPNPEYPENLTQALLQAQVGKADLVLANDGDGDRIGIMLRQKDGSYVTLDGNQIGCFLAYYILKRRQEQNKLTGKELLISTVVSSPLLQKIARKFSVDYRSTLTGFKWMGNLAAELAQSEGKELVLAYEEAFGVAVGGARDKDGISAALLAAEAAAWCKQQGKNLTDLIQEMHRDCGVHLEGAHEEYYEGATGQSDMAAIINKLRQNPPQVIGDDPVIEIIDYQSQKRTFGNKAVTDEKLPRQNMIFLKTTKSWMAVRPSGTEPKVKAYFGIALDPADNAISMVDARATLAKLNETARAILRAF